jgi:hypothetical protein
MFEIIYRCDPSAATQRVLPADTKDALRRLEEGNRTFASLTTAAPEGSRVVYFDLEVRLVEAPASNEEFGELVVQVAGSSFIRRLVECETASR